MWEGNTLRKVHLYGPTCENTYWRMKFKFPYNISVIKLRILEWFGRGLRIGGERTVKELMKGKQGAGGKKVNSRLRWKVDVELDLRNVSVNLVRTSVVDRAE
jgi:hypothetical protein